MAQLRHDYRSFVDRDAAILVAGPENADKFQAYWQKENLPFTGLPDPDHRVADVYGQQVKLLKFGRMPALIVIDKQGFVRFQNHGSSMQGIPPNQEVLALLDSISDL